MNIANSPRLCFEMMGQDDGQLLFELDQDPEVMRYINGGRPSTMDEISNILLPRLKAYTNPEKGWGIWKVSTLSDNSALSSRYIGWILVRPMDFFGDSPQYHDIEVGWRFKQCCWGKGYATEAASAVATQIAKQTDVSYLSAVADEGNLASIKIMQKLGMTFNQIAQYPTPKGYVEVVHYQMSADKL
ncbi:GNAT family N-acetyltransferase [Shewanella psychrotolerans]|uniref:GNAT family N-acetyltransferase n=1 Tax=Shewanella psychrotolerans TaxID=2864206 RepID=UPI001C65CBC4|nr:GNAT family N-acetyltransferase [Shewanella psychrotolerans]QYJ99767.1 GNAT family N-acetyltransferase [Shewanella psychrotolerans]